MFEGLAYLFSQRPLSQVAIDVLDLVIVTYIVYRALLVLRGTRAIQAGTGLGIMFLVYVVSKWAGLITLFNLLSTLLSSIILIVVVVFQNDIRRGLMRIGSRAFLGGGARQQAALVIDEVVAAATELARHRMGALICFEQEANLDEFVVGQGTILDAVVQRELLVTIFYPDTSNKLHDGAIVIRDLRIAKAGVFFPMPDTKVLDKSLGSRHRAALGITEETDAVVVVVSEERGTISLCFNGNIISNLDGAALRSTLQHFFGQKASKKKAAKKAKGAVGAGAGPVRITVPPAQPVIPAAPVLTTGDKSGSTILSPTGSLRPEPLHRADLSVPKAVPMAPAKPIETPLSPGMSGGRTSLMPPAAPLPAGAMPAIPGPPATPTIPPVGIPSEKRPSNPPAPLPMAPLRDPLQQPGLATSPASPLPLERRDGEDA